MSSPLPLLIAQLRAAYPGAGLLSELLAIESNRFVVRALIQVGSLTLATGMAAAADLETAEDRAKCRAIETLMPSRLIPSEPILSEQRPVPLPVPAPATIEPPVERPVTPPAAKSIATPGTMPAAAPSIPSLPVQPPVSPESRPAEPLPTNSALSESLTDWDNPLLASPSGSTLDPNFDLNSLLQENSALAHAAEEDALPAAADLFSAVNADASLSIDPPVNLADLNLTRLSSLPKTDASETEATSRSEKPARRKSAAAPPAEPDPAPAPPAEIDRSGEIARIGVEMKRLGWDTKKGRDHLQKTYGKRSRQELNDDELMDFLHYLETQPSSAQMPF